MARSLTEKVENRLFFASEESERAFSRTANKHKGIPLSGSNFLSLVDMGLATIKYPVVFGYSFITGPSNDNYMGRRKREEEYKSMKKSGELDSMTLEEAEEKLGITKIRSLPNWRYMYRY